jgi:hypothetical protein
LAGAQSATNKVAQTVSKTIASAGAAHELPVRDAEEEGGGTWVRDGAPKRRNERSKRQRLLNAARASLERAQAKVAETGEGLKQKTHRSAIQASGTLARGFRKLLPPSGDGSDAVQNARRLADFTACQAEVARIRDLRSQQHLAGRYNGRIRRAPNVGEDRSEPTRPASPPAAVFRPGPRGRVDALHARVEKELREAEAQEAAARGTYPMEGNETVAQATSEAPPSSMAFDLVGDEELLYAYQVALDELEVDDKKGGSDESEIIALAISGMQLHSDLVPFAIARLYDLVGLEAECGAPEAPYGDLQRAAVDPEQSSQGSEVGKVERRQESMSTERSEEESQSEDDGEYISANSLNPALAQRIALT